MQVQQQVDEGSITPIELQAELDTLRSLRRRSISQPSEGIDPDLPPSPSKFSHGSPPSSPKQLHHVGGPSDASAAFAGPSSASGSSSSPSNRSLGPSHLSSDIVEEEEPAEDQPLADNLSELFWLPARLHPEIAPQEFRNFIRDQTKPENLLRRSGSQLGRRKSMLSRQYQPSDTDTESASLFTSYADSTPGTSPSISRRPSRAGSFRRSTGLERLTLADLQKLETIARQAAEEGQTGDEGEAQLKRLVRRSLSLNPAAILGVADQLRDDDSYVEDDTDSPLIVPPPGSILRRSARTKIRKNSLLGDGGGHRFGPSRRGTKAVDAPLSEDLSNPPTSRRHPSISSLNSTEEDGGTSEAGRPTSTEFRRRSPRSPGSSEKLQYTAEPLPMQYVPSSALSLAERMDSADLGPQDSNKMTVSPVRAGADMPQSDHSPTGALQWSFAPTTEDGSSRPVMPTTGSLRTARRIGGQAQATPELFPRTSSAGAKALSPPPSGPLALPASPEASSLHLFDAPDASTNTRAGVVDNRPAVPSKPADTVQAELQASAPIRDKPAVEMPKTHSRADSAVQQERPKSVPDAKASQIPRKSPTSPVTASPKEKEKEKKSTWAKLGLSRSTKDEPDADDAASIASTSSGGSGTFGRKGKKSKKDKVQDEFSPEKKAHISNAFVDKAEKQDGPASFFGGLFGKKKGEPMESSKKDGTHSPTPMQMPTPPPTASGMLTPDGKYINFYRLPIHIERAVYRLSHIKLANPRRPLYEQVLISNLMFWYLGVINKPVGQPSQVQQRPPPEQQQVQPVPVPVSHAFAAELVTNESRPIPARKASRPQMTRENSSNSGTTVPGLHSQVGAEGLLEHENGNDIGSVAGQRPASHPPSIVRSPSTELADADGGIRSRPQTMPANGSNTLHEEAHSSPKQATQSYRYQDYITTAPTPDPSFNGYQTVNHTSTLDTVSGERDDEVWQDMSGRKARRFSSESAETDDVRYEGRKASVELDTYDIIAAYADEEKRKSMLALQATSDDNSRGARSTSPPSSSVSLRNGHKAHTHENRSHNSAYRATPPRQSSMTAHAIHQSPQQQAVALPGSARHTTKSPPPPRARSPPTHLT